MNAFHHTVTVGVLLLRIRRVQADVAKVACAIRVAILLAWIRQELAVVLAVAPAIAIHLSNRRARLRPTDRRDGDLARPREGDLDLMRHGRVVRAVDELALSLEAATQLCQDAL